MPTKRRYLYNALLGAILAGMALLFASPRWGIALMCASCGSLLAVVAVAGLADGHITIRFEESSVEETAFRSREPAAFWSTVVFFAAAALGCLAMAALFAVGRLLS